MILCLWRNHQTTKYGRSFAWQIINGIFILLFSDADGAKTVLSDIWTYSYNMSNIILATKLNCTHTNMAQRSLKSKYTDAKCNITFLCVVEVHKFECNAYFVCMEPTIDVHIIHLCEYSGSTHSLWKSNEIIWVYIGAYNMLYEFEQNFNIFLLHAHASGGEKEEEKEYVFGHTVRF